MYYKPDHKFKQMIDIFFFFVTDNTITINIHFVPSQLVSICKNVTDKFPGK